MTIRIEHFTTPSGLTLVADAAGDPKLQPAIFLHGGGQTRGSWKASLRAVAEIGFHAIAIDARGHGDSSWSPEADYGLDTMAADLAFVLEQLAPDPVLIGASLGGLTALLLTGEEPEPTASALVLVDVAPRVNMQGVERILAFMGSRPDGFATLDDAADALATYNPHRPRPVSAEGLRRIMREREGRYFWHWDPAFLDDRGPLRDRITPRLEAAARRISVPALLIHAGQSDIIQAEELENLRDLMPGCRYARIDRAGHMVAGDDNDHFNAAIVDFLTDVRTQPNRTA